MYEWLWRHLPGGRFGRPALALLLLVAALALLFMVVFPWVEPRLPFNDSNVGQDSGLRSPHSTSQISSQAQTARRGGAS